MARTCYLAALAAAAIGASADDDCKYSIQLLHLQDISGSFTNAMETMKIVAPQILGNLTAAYPGTQIALSTFTDKPVPGVGYGFYGGYWIKYADKCFISNLDWTTDATVYQNALGGVMMLAGLDFPEAQLEALYQASYGANFTPDDHDKDGRPVVRIIMQITDAPSHIPGDFQSNVDSYNRPRVWDETTKNSTGGWGSTQWAMNVSTFNPDFFQDWYDNVQGVIYKKDHGIALTDEETEILEANALIFPGSGPMQFPSPLPHPSIGPVDCLTVEYPEVSYVGNVLKSMNITPIVLVADPTQGAVPTLNDHWCGENPIVDSANLTQRLDCMKSIYTNYFEEMGVPSYSVGTMSMDASDIVEQMMAAIGKVVAQICLTSTESPTTIAATTSSEAEVVTTIPVPPVPVVVTTIPVTPVPVVVTTIPVPPVVVSTIPVPPVVVSTIPVPPVVVSTIPVTPVVVSTIPVPPVVVSTIPVPPVVSTSGASPTTTITTPVTTTSEGTAAAAAADGGSSTVIIASAAAGGAAAIAAGFLVYKKMAVGALSKGNAAALQAAGQVDAPEAPIERETMEEITMDMFR